LCVPAQTQSVHNLTFHQNCIASCRQFTSPYQRNCSRKLALAPDSSNTPVSEAQLSSYRGSLCRDDRPQLALSSRDQLFIHDQLLKSKALSASDPLISQNPTITWLKDLVHCTNVREMVVYCVRVAVTSGDVCLG